MSLDALAVSKNAKEYRCRKPQYSPYYRCIEDNYKEFERIYDTKYQEKFGYFRQIISKVIYQYLNCGILVRIPAYSDSDSGDIRTVVPAASGHLVGC